MTKIILKNGDVVETRQLHSVAALRRAAKNPRLGQLHDIGPRVVFRGAGAYTAIIYFDTFAEALVYRDCFAVVSSATMIKSVLGYLAMRLWRRLAFPVGPVYPDQKAEI